MLLSFAVSCFGIKIHFIIRVSFVRRLPADAALSDRVEIVMRFSVLGRLGTYVYVLSRSWRKFYGNMIF